MKRSIVFGTLLAVALVLGMSVTAMAAGPGPYATGIPGTGLAAQGAGLSDAFVDGDLDGTCDSYETRVPLLDGAGYGGATGWWGNSSQAQVTAPGSAFVDNDGDGVCDDCVPVGTNPQDGTGNRYQRGGRWN